MAAHKQPARPEPPFFGRFFPFDPIIRDRPALVYGMVLHLHCGTPVEDLQQEEKIAYPCRTGTDGACRSSMELQGPGSFGWPTCGYPSSPSDGWPGMDQKQGSQVSLPDQSPARANPELAMSRGEASGRTELAPNQFLPHSKSSMHWSTPAHDSSKGDGPQIFAADGCLPVWILQHPSH
jgi:hypothetical protein